MMTLKRLAAIMAVMVLMAGAMPTGVSAAERSAEEKSAVEKSAAERQAEKSAAVKQAEKIAKEIIEQNEDGRDPFDFVENDPKLALQDELPEKFDLSAKFIDDGDNTPYVTPVRFQNPFGTCWGFASIAAAESSLLGSGLAKKDHYDASTLDLSEKHLMYFVNEALSDPESPQNGEGTHAEEGISLVQKLNMGGHVMYATNLFASGIGPNLEDRDDVEEDLLKYRGLQGNVIKRKINGKLADFCYDDEDDWSLPEKYRFYQSYILKESSILPTPAGETRDMYEYNPDATLAMKNELYQKRALTVAFHADSFMPGQETGDGQYISRNWAHYTYDGAMANHGVCIVGWDDTYPKENFVEGHNPPADGAWLVKNSWGSGEEPFPAKGGGDWGIPNKDGDGTGYFWLSYYDRSLSMIESFEFDKSNVGKQYYLDQHDLLGTSSYDIDETKVETRMANVFKAEFCQDIEQVSCQTVRPGTTVKTEVYLLNDAFDDPEDGLLAAEKTETYPMGGFHKMELPVPVTVQKNQYYSVIQTHISPDGKYTVVIPQANGKEFSSLFNLSKWSEGVINLRESYLCGDTGWFDYKYLTDLLNSGDQKDIHAFDNLPIKAYCTPRDNIHMHVDGIVELVKKGVDAETSKKIRVSFKGDKGLLPDDVKVTAKLEEGGDEIVQVVPDPSDDTRYTIKALKEGTTRLIITSPGIGTSIVKINVVKPTLKVAIIIDYGRVYTGKAIKCDDIDVIDNLGEFVDPKFYKVTYKNNVKCGRATAVVSPATDYYTGTVSATFTIKPKRASVSKVAAGKSKLTITVKNQKASGVTKYQVTYRQSGTKTWKNKTFSSKKNVLTLTGLKKGSKYDFRVRAYAKDAGYGRYSAVTTSSKVK